MSSIPHPAPSCNGNAPVPPEAFVDSDLAAAPAAFLDAARRYAIVDDQWGEVPDPDAWHAEHVRPAWRAYVEAEKELVATLRDHGRAGVVVGGLLYVASAACAVKACIRGDVSDLALAI